MSEKKEKDSNSKNIEIQKTEWKALILSNLDRIVENILRDASNFCIISQKGLKISSVVLYLMKGKEDPR